MHVMGLIVYGVRPMGEAHRLAAGCGGKRGCGGGRSEGDGDCMVGMGAVSVFRLAKDEGRREWPFACPSVHACQLAEYAQQMLALWAACMCTACVTTGCAPLTVMLLLCCVVRVPPAAILVAPMQATLIFGLMHRIGLAMDDTCTAS